MDRTGVVVGEMGNFSKVKLMRHTACGNCGACQLGDDQKDIMLIAKNTVKAHMGDLVEVTMATNGVLSAAFIMYVLPLGGLFVGLILAQLLGVNEIMSALIGLIAMVAVFAVIKINDEKFLKSEKYTAQIINILQTNHDGLMPL